MKTSFDSSEGAGQIAQSHLAPSQCTHYYFLPFSELRAHRGTFFAGVIHEHESCPYNRNRQTAILTSIFLRLCYLSLQFGLCVEFEKVSENSSELLDVGVPLLVVITVVHLTEKENCWPSLENVENLTFQ